MFTLFVQIRKRAMWLLFTDSNIIITGYANRHPSYGAKAPVSSKRLIQELTQTVNS